MKFIWNYIRKLSISSHMFKLALAQERNLCLIIVVYYNESYVTFKYKASSLNFVNVCMVRSLLFKFVKLKLTAMRCDALRPRFYLVTNNMKTSEIFIWYKIVTYFAHVLQVE